MNKATKLIPDIDDLSIDELIGQTLCFGWDATSEGPATQINDHALALVEEMNVGSIVLMGRNHTPNHIEAITNAISELQSRSKIPLFIAVDQEGGVVNRFTPIDSPFHQFPGNMALGAVAKGSSIEVARELAARQAAIQAQELTQIGVNLNFSPVADVNNNPANPIIGVRSFGEDPEIVGELALVIAQTYQTNGILACAKHFPGHGDTSTDSHLALPTIDIGEERFENVEMVPFKKLIDDGVGAIMSSHIVFPLLDPDRPATMSSAVLTGLLRDKLHYQGLIITDCLEMDAIAKSPGTGKGAVAALCAGADIVLVCHTLSTQREVVRDIKAALVSGELSLGRLQESVTRILDAKGRYLTDLTARKPDILGNADEVEALIANQSITLVCGHPADIACLRMRPTLFMSMHSSIKTLSRILSKMGAETECLHLGGRLQGPDELPIDISKFDKAIVLTCPREAWSSDPIDQEEQTRIVQYLYSRRPDLVCVALREPYDIVNFPMVENYICTYGYSDSQLIALSKLLYDNLIPTGSLPVTIPTRGHTN